MARRIESAWKLASRFAAHWPARPISSRASVHAAIQAIVLRCRRRGRAWAVADAVCVGSGAGVDMVGGMGAGPTGGGRILP
ncbi:hypothetical protein GmRootV15_15590 [Variovorax sp. V15]